MASYLEILTAFVAILLAVYSYLTWSFDFWKKRGVPGPRPIPVFGNMKDSIMRKISVNDYLKTIYHEYRNEPMVGIFTRRTPTLVIQDLDVIRDVLIKDFSYFPDRIESIQERVEPLSVHLFNINAERWRPLRVNLSPVFTSSKLKDMFHLITECSGQMETYVEKSMEMGKPVDCREMAARYATDVIGSCAFGINMNALSDEESEFRRVGKEMFQPTLGRKIRKLLRESSPWFYDLLGFVLPQTESTKVFTRIIRDTIKYREENGVVRPDFVNKLMELKKHPEKLKNVELTDTLLSAQAFVFFAAGFETSSTNIACALYELALNPDIQDKLREEIKQYYSKDKENLSYEDIKKLKYLDKVFQETLRKYPSLTVLTRKSNSSYTFSGTKISIPKDTYLLMPIHAIHMDPSIFPNPEVFDPERFDDDAVAARHPMCHLPFGSGPRNCIGARLAHIQVKIALIKLLRIFRVDVCEETMIKYIPHTFLLMISTEGVRLKFARLNS